MSLLQEYLDDKGKMVKAKEDISGGKPCPATPPANAPKEHGGSYESKGIKNSDKGLGDIGEKEPKTKAVKIPVAEQIEICDMLTRSFKKDPQMIETFVDLIKKRNLLGPLVAEVLSHNDTFGHIGEILKSENYGEHLSRQFRQTFNENVSKPMNKVLSKKQKDKSKLGK